jgi:hypothetical protein
VDEELLAGARRAQQRMIDAERDAAVARAEFHRAVHLLASGSSPPQDVAAALGLTARQLHEIAPEIGRHDLFCSFCGSAQLEVGKLIAGPGAYICDACVGLAGGVASSGEAAGTPQGQLRAVPRQDPRAVQLLRQAPQSAPQPGHAGGRQATRGPSGTPGNLPGVPVAVRGDHHRGAELTRGKHHCPFG